MCRDLFIYFPLEPTFMYFTDSLCILSDGQTMAEKTAQLPERRKEDGSAT